MLLLTKKKPSKSMLVEEKDIVSTAWSECSEKLFHFIIPRVSTVEDAEDILQDVFIKAYSNIEKFETGSNLNAWLFAITRNTITDYYRSNTKSKLSSVELVQDLFETPEVDNDFCCLEPHINELPSHYKQVIFLSEIKGIKHQEIANRLGLSLSAIKSRVVRGRELLKEKFVDCCKYHINKEGKLTGDPDCDRPECNH